MTFLVALQKNEDNVLNWIYIRYHLLQFEDFFTFRKWIFFLQTNWWKRLTVTEAMSNDKCLAGNFQSNWTKYNCLHVHILWWSKDKAKPPTDLGKKYELNLFFKKPLFDTINENFQKNITFINSAYFCREQPQLHHLFGLKEMKALLIWSNNTSS